jgi:hypothetical protein
MCLQINPCENLFGIELVEYVCTHPCLINCFSEEDPDFVPEDVE